MYFEYFALLWSRSLGLILLSAALAKLAAPSESAAALVEHRMATKRTAQLVSALEIVGEIALGGALLVGFRVADGLRLAGFAFLVFAVLMAHALRRSDSAPRCGCLGKVLEIRAQRSSVITNSSIAVAAFVVSPFAEEPLTSVGTAVPLWAAASLLAVLYWLAAYAWTVSSRIDQQLFKWAES